MACTPNTISLAEFLFKHLETRPIPHIHGLGSLPIIERALAVLAACKANIRTGGRQPLYDPDTDIIVMPPRAYFTVAKTFTRPKRYAQILLHELVHWTAHPHRLNRPMPRETYDETYRKEELIAELGAALLCHDLAIDKHPALPHAHYLNHYLVTLPKPEIDLSLALTAAHHATAYLVTMTRNKISGL